MLKALAQRFLDEAAGGHDRLAACGYKALQLFDDVLILERLHGQQHGRRIRRKLRNAFNRHTHHAQIILGVILALRVDGQIRT